MTVEILPTDRVFQDSPDAGHPACLCSRCLQRIEEEDVPIRAWPLDEHGQATDQEYRYHPTCLGLRMAGEFHEFEDQGP